MPTPKFSFQSGELAISTTTRLFRIRGWPEPHACEKLGGGDWKNSRPEFRLVKPQMMEINTSASGVMTPCEDSCGPDLIQTGDAPDEKRRAFEAFRCQLPPVLHRTLNDFRAISGTCWSC